MLRFSLSLLFVIFRRFIQFPSPLLSLLVLWRPCELVDHSEQQQKFCNPVNVINTPAVPFPCHQCRPPCREDQHISSAVASSSSQRRGVSTTCPVSSSPAVVALMTRETCKFSRHLVLALIHSLVGWQCVLMFFVVTLASIFRTYWFLTLLFSSFPLLFRLH